MALLTDNVNLHRGVIHKLHLKEFLHLPHKENTHEEEEEEEEEEEQQQQQNIRTKLPKIALDWS